MPSKVMEQFAVQVGLRIKVARESAGLTQEQLSAQMGFNDRQILAAIEAGNRKVSAEELMRFIATLSRDIEFFTDPYRMVGEARFSFRAKGVEDGGLEAFEETACQWIAFWREQERRQKIASSPLRPRLTLTTHSTFEEAQKAGEDLVREFNLGEIPAERLVSAIEEKLSLLVLYVDMPLGISGAACQVPGADAILVNRRDSEGRRNFDLAHELFHVLTWDALPPQRVDLETATSGTKVKRVEHLANNFAGALLMPRAVLEPLWKAREEKGLSINDWCATVSSQLRVSAPALIARLMALEFIRKADAPVCSETASAVSTHGIPPPYSRRFLDRAGQAIERADVSVMRLVKLLNATGRGELKTMFQAHGLQVPSGV